MSRSSTRPCRAATPPTPPRPQTQGRAMPRARWEARRRCRRRVQRARVGGRRSALLTAALRGYAARPWEALRRRKGSLMAGGAPGLMGRSSSADAAALCIVGCWVVRRPWPGARRDCLSRHAMPKGGGASSEGPCNSLQVAWVLIDVRVCAVCYPPVVERASVGRGCGSDPVQRARAVNWGRDCISPCWAVVLALMAV